MAPVAQGQSNAFTTSTGAPSSGARHGVLRDSRLFRYLGEAERERLWPQVEFVQAQRGEFVVQRFDNGGAIYIVLEGLVVVNQYARSGREVSYRRLTAGRSFGELSAIDRMPRSANILALTDVRIAKLPERLVGELLSGSPGFARAIMEDLAAMVRALSSRVFELNAVSAACRTQMEIVRMAFNVGVTDNGAVISPVPTHAEIAALIGAQREAVTRELRRLEGRGWLTRQGRTLKVTDIEALMAEIEDMGGDQPDL